MPVGGQVIEVQPSRLHPSFAASSRRSGENDRLSRGVCERCTSHLCFCSYDETDVVIAFKTLSGEPPRLLCTFGIAILWRM